MNPLLKDKLFLSLLIPAIVLLVISLLGISIEAWDKYTLHLPGTSEEWNTFFILYKIPLSIAAGIITVFALFTSLHRINLQNAQLNVQSEQLNDAKKLNEFNIYFKQRDEFDKKFSTLISEWVKKLLQSGEFRLNEFFEDFDPMEYLRKEYDPEQVSKSTNVICLRIYEFCFGVGRRISLSNEFKSFMSDVYAQLYEIENAAGGPPIEMKQNINEYIRKNFIEGGKITYWHGTYENEWFSDNEKFHLTLAIARLLSEVEAFSGEPRDTDILERLCSPGQSSEHSFLYGPLLILGERNKSPGALAGRRPNLDSVLMGIKKGGPNTQN